MLVSKWLFVFIFLQHSLMGMGEGEWVKCWFFLVMFFWGERRGKYFFSKKNYAKIFIKDIDLCHYYSQNYYHLVKNLIFCPKPVQILCKLWEFGLGEIEKFWLYVMMGKWGVCQILIRGGGIHPTSISCPSIF